MPAGCASSSCVTTLGGGFSDPWGVAVDGSGNVYVADDGNSAVKEMPAGCASSSLRDHAGRRLQRSHGVAVDGSGNVYVADYWQQCGEGDARRLRLVQLRDDAGRRLQLIPLAWRWTAAATSTSPMSTTVR